MKIAIFDAGPLINLSMNGLLDILIKLKKSDIELVITDYVYQEVVDHPSHIPRFELGALRIKDLITSKVLKFATELGVSKKEIDNETARLMKIANTAIRSDNRPVEIISLAETSCLALSNILRKMKIQNIIAIDERTTRILFEKPENLKKIMESRLHHPLTIDTRETISEGPYTFIRSSELVYTAYKKGVIKIEDKRALEALLYATKYKGCAISWEEIEQLKRQ